MVEATDDTERSIDTDKKNINKHLLSLNEKAKKEKNWIIVVLLLSSVNKQTNEPWLN